MVILIVCGCPCYMDWVWVLSLSDVLRKVLALISLLVKSGNIGTFLLNFAVLKLIEDILRDFTKHVGLEMN